MTTTATLPYLNAAITESLRIYPASASSLPRVTPSHGCVIAGRYVPGNAAVSVNHWATYHSESNFKRPFEFLPERWMGEKEFESDKRKICQPFSVGPRACIGRSLAWAEMRCIVARLVWGFEFEFESREGKDWARQRVFLVYEKGPLMVKLRPVGKV